MPCEIMALTVGSQLGSHEITALLGEGGKGEVASRFTGITT
jgi:hypothetical protein